MALGFIYVTSKELLKGLADITPVRVGMQII